VTGSRAKPNSRVDRELAGYVIGPDVAIRLAHEQVVIREEHQILAPALLRSQLLSLLYQAVRRNEMTRKDAQRHLDYVRGLRILTHRRRFIRSRCPLFGPGGSVRAGHRRLMGR
jgi:hypothetical protein